jgi:hypothetical protein
MKRSRWAFFLLAATAVLFGQRADASRTPLTDVRAAITQPQQLTDPVTAAATPTDAWLVESITPLGHTDDGHPIALISFLVPSTSLAENTPVSTRAGPYAAPKTHTRVFYIGQPPLGLDVVIVIPSPTYGFDRQGRPVFADTYLQRIQIQSEAEKKRLEMANPDEPVHIIHPPDYRELQSKLAKIPEVSRLSFRSHSAGLMGGMKLVEGDSIEDLQTLSSRTIGDAIAGVKFSENPVVEFQFCFAFSEGLDQEGQRRILSREDEGYIRALMKANKLMPFELRVTTGVIVVTDPYVRKTDKGEFERVIHREMSTGNYYILNFDAKAKPTVSPTKWEYIGHVKRVDLEVLGPYTRPVQ